MIGGDVPFWPTRKFGGFWPTHLQHDESHHVTNNYWLKQQTATLFSAEQYRTKSGHQQLNNDSNILTNEQAYSSR